MLLEWLINCCGEGAGARGEVTLAAGTLGVNEEAQEVRGQLSPEITLLQTPG